MVACGGGSRAGSFTASANGSSAMKSSLVGKGHWRPMIQSSNPVKQIPTDNSKALPSSAVVCAIYASAPWIHWRGRDPKTQTKARNKCRNLVSSQQASTLICLLSLRLAVGLPRLFLFIPDHHQLIGSCLLCTPTLVFLCLFCI